MLTNHIEPFIDAITHMAVEFEKELKTAVKFIDLTAANDTVWRERSIDKLIKVIASLKICRINNNLLAK